MHCRYAPGSGHSNSFLRGVKLYIRDKKNLRKSVQLARDKIEPGVRLEKSKIIAERFASLPEYKTAKTILLYYPFRSEPDIRIIIDRALCDGKKIVLPKVEGNMLKLFYVNDIAGQLKIGAFGIMEPDEDKCKGAAVNDIELALVPGVCFDRFLNRLGYGGGFYDRLLPCLPESAKKISVCFQEQMVDKIPSGKYDIAVDMVLTEKKTYKNGKNLPGK